MNPILMGQAEHRPDPRAGDVCRMRGRHGLWMPYEGVGGAQFRFARYPKLDAVRTMELAHVEEVVHPCESTEARAFWKLVVGGRTQ